jgi:uncharacterized protein YjbJ (UPF0337 family)
MEKNLMNADQMKGKAAQVAGKVKQGAGEMTGNDRLANEGVADQVKGSVQETWGNVKDAARETAKTREHERHEDAARARQNIARNVHEAKERANEKIDSYKEDERDRRSA